MRRGKSAETNTAEAREGLADAAEYGVCRASDGLGESVYGGRCFL